MLPAMFGLRKAVKDAAQTALRPSSLLGAGSDAPAFDLLAHDGQRVRSVDLAGEHYVLVFYPGDDTSTCTAQLADFDAVAPRFAEQGCRIFGVNSASAESHRAFVDKLGYQHVKLLVDEGRKVAMAFQTARPGVPVTFRAVFFVDRKGIVRLAMKGRPDIDSVLRAVERNNETGNKGMGRKGRLLVPEVSGYGLRKLQENDERTTVVDIRDPADWEHGHVPGSLNVPIDWLIQRMTELPGKDVPLVIACDQGLRATGAAKMLKDSGWRKLYTLIDGMEAYKGELENGSGERRSGARA
jgi:peroxiredoxin Q/BCP